MIPLRVDDLQLPRGPPHKFYVTHGGNRLFYALDKIGKNIEYWFAHLILKEGTLVSQTISFIWLAAIMMGSIPYARYVITGGIPEKIPLPVIVYSILNTLSTNWIRNGERKAKNYNYRVLIFRNSIIERIIWKSPLYGLEVIPVTPKGTTHSKDHEYVMRKYGLEKHTASAYMIALKARKILRRP